MLDRLSIVNKYRPRVEGIKQQLWVMYTHKQKTGLQNRPKSITLNRLPSNTYVVMSWIAPNDSACLTLMSTACKILTAVTPVCIAE